MGNKAISTLTGTDLTQNPRYIAAYDLIDWLDDSQIIYRQRGYFKSIKDHALYRFLVSNSIRYKKRYFFIIEHLTQRAVHELDKEAIACLLLGLTQLEEESRVDEYAAVNETVNLISFFGKPFLKGFINANLRTYLRKRQSIEAITDQQSLEIRSSHPPHFVKRWKSQFGDELTKSICNANNIQPQLQLVLNPNISHDKITDDLTSRGFKIKIGPDNSLVIENPLGLFKTKWATSGAFLIQDRSSQLINRLIKNLPKKRVLDGCAAPGGKLFHMEWVYGAEIDLMIALDDSAGRIKRLQNNKATFNSKVNIIQMDATRPSLHPDFDLVLIDAPCSSTGTIRKHPEIKWNRYESDFLKNQEKQLELLKALKNKVRSGGHIVYITCSLEKEENQDVVEKFQELYQNEFKQVPFDNSLIDQQYLTREGYFLCLPTQQQMGNFAVLFQKR